MPHILKHFVLPFLFFSPLVCFAQNSDPQQTLEKIIDHAQHHSLYRNDVDWSALKKEMHTLAREAKSVTDLEAALDLMLKKLNDTHGRVFHNDKMLSYYSGYRWQFG